MATPPEDLDLSVFGDSNSSGLPFSESAYNFSIQDVIDTFGKQHKILDTYFLNALIVVYVVLMVTGLFSNTMVWLVVARRAQMRTPRNFYVVNLTVSDISLCLISMPFTLINFIQMQWKLGEAMCKLVPVVQGTNIFVSTGTVMAIALDRYFTIVRSKGAPQNSNRVLLSIALIWIVSCLFTLPIIFYQVLEEVSIGGYIVSSHCIEKWPSSSMRAAYTIGLLVFQLLIPILVLAGVHVAIANHLNSHRIHGSGSTGTNHGGGGGGGGGSVSRKGSTLKKISKSSIFRIRSKKKHQHTILDETMPVVAAGKRNILNGNDNALYNISSDDACKFLATTTTSSSEMGAVIGKQNCSARVTDYELQPSNGFPLNNSNEGRVRPAEIATTALEQDSVVPESGRKGSVGLIDDHTHLQGRQRLCGGETTNTYLPNPLQVRFKSNIGVCITFREFCQLSDGKSAAQKKRVELENYNNTAISNPSNVNQTEGERKLSSVGSSILEDGRASPPTHLAVRIGNEKNEQQPHVGPIADANLHAGAQENGNTTAADTSAAETSELPTTPLAPSPSAKNGSSASSKRTKKELARNKRTTIILLSVSVIFTVSWMPWHLLTLWADLYPNFTSTSKLYTLYAICHIMAMTSAVTNAVLYGWLNTNLRRELTQMLSSWVKR